MLACIKPYFFYVIVGFHICNVNRYVAVRDFYCFSSVHFILLETQIASSVCVLGTKNSQGICRRNTVSSLPIDNGRREEVRHSVKIIQSCGQS